MYTYEEKIQALQTYDEIGFAAELKLEILHRCFELSEDVKSVAHEVGYSRASIYAWRRKYLRKETISLMNHNDVPQGKLNPDVYPSEI